MPPDSVGELRTEVGGGRRQLRQAEVEDLDQPVVRDHDVVGLQVAVNDAGAVRLRQALGDLRADLDHGGFRCGFPPATRPRSDLPSTHSIAM